MTIHVEEQAGQTSQETRPRRRRQGLQQPTLPRVPTARSIRHTMPAKIDSQAAGLRKGSHRGWPPDFDEGWSKQHRVVASRCDKRRYVHLCTSTATALTTRLRARSPGRVLVRLGSEQFQMCAGGATKGVDLPARPAHPLGIAERAPLKRASDPPREPSGPLAGVLHEARFQSHRTTLCAPYVVHRESVRSGCGPQPSGSACVIFIPRSAQRIARALRARTMRGRRAFCLLDNAGVSLFEGTARSQGRRRSTARERARRSWV